MSPMMADYIHSKHIDSFQKLYFLLFLYHHPKMKCTAQEFAERSYLGSTFLIEAIITDLRTVGLLDQTQNLYKLSNDPEIKSSLQDLVRVFENPLTRQELLDQIKHTDTVFH